MPEFYADWQGMLRGSTDISELNSKMNGTLQKLRGLEGRLADFGDSTDTIKAALRSANGGLDKTRDLLTKCSSVVSEASSLYKKCEGDLSGISADGDVGNNSSTNNNGSGSGTQEISGNVELVDLDLFDDIFKVVGGVGASGSIASFVYNLIRQGDNGFEGLVKIGKSAVKTIGKILPKDGVIDWFGRAAVGNVKVGASWFENFKSSLGGSMDDLFHNASKGKAVCKWADIVLSGILNGIDNYQEQNGSINLRGISETVIETASDIGLDMAVGAGLTAAIVSITGACPPAGAVAAASTVIVIGADMLTEHLTGRKIHEWVSDTICNAAETFVEDISDYWTGYQDYRQARLNSFTDYYTDTAGLLRDGIQVTDVGPFLNSTVDYFADKGKNLFDYGADVVNNAFNSFGNFLSKF